MSLKLFTMEEKGTENKKWHQSC